MERQKRSALTSVVEQELYDLYLLVEDTWGIPEERFIEVMTEVSARLEQVNTKIKSSLQNST